MVCVGGAVIDNKCKCTQFVVIFWILKLGQPFIDFEKMKELFEFSKVKNTPCKYWSNSTNWQMVETMHQIVSRPTNDIEVVMVSTCIMPFLKVVHVLIKFTQSRDSFVCDFVASVTMCYVEFYNMYMLIQKRNIPRRGSTLLGFA